MGKSNTHKKSNQIPNTMKSINPTKTKLGALKFEKNPFKDTKKYYMVSGLDPSLQIK